MSTQNLISVKDARAAMVQHFELDGEGPGSFRDTYIANIAVLLWERFDMSHDKANEAADQILKLVFGE